MGAAVRGAFEEAVSHAHGSTPASARDNLVPDSNSVAETRGFRWATQYIPCAGCDAFTLFRTDLASRLGCQPSVAAITGAMNKLARLYVDGEPTRPTCAACGKHGDGEDGSLQSAGVGIPGVFHVRCLLAKREAERKSAAPTQSRIKPVALGVAIGSALSAALYGVWFYLAG